jgi:polysaccharide chain length determinant protein (PEP-CTERM system associated)
MIENRELTMDDYLAMLRRRLKAILIPVLLAPLVGFAISFVIPPKYTSESLVLDEEQKVPEGYVKPIVTEDLSERVTTLEQRALSAEQLRPIIERLNLAHGAAVDGVIQEIRDGVSIEAVAAVVIPSKSNPTKSNVPGFNVDYTSSSPRQAQEICSELTNLIIRQNFADREQVAKDTTEFLGRQLEDAKRNLDELDSRLADFKKHYIGQLPGDEDNNMRILMGLNSQLEANTQTLNRTQQDKAYTDSLLAQQVAAWKSSQNSTDPATLEKQMADLQTQLVTLEARYTDDYPDVIKTKRDIQELQKKIDQVNAAASDPSSIKDTRSVLAEPPEIRQLRLQLHQYQDAITQATRDQDKINEQIKLYQGRVAISPAVEEQYKQLTRDYETAQKFYNDLLEKKSESEMQTAMEQEQQGEQMRILRPADLPDSPSFPNRWMFAGGGLAAGLTLGFGLAIWLELRDTCVRTEEDVVAVMELPVLSQLPWVGIEEAEKNGSAKRKSGGSRLRDESKEAVEV